MKQTVDDGLPKPGAPIVWATVADGILYTAQIPIRKDGSIETGDIAVQTALTLDNLKRAVTAAGGGMADVTQVLVYLPDPSDFAGMNEVYARTFKKPYPNRATIVAKLMVPGARIEIVAYAHIGRKAQAPARPRAKSRSKAPSRASKKTGKRATAKAKSPPRKRTRR
jgi:enamine deaminase RidA (YjgF/YER057c/UK114 family)